MQRSSNGVRNVLMYTTACSGNGVETYMVVPAFMKGSVSGKGRLYLSMQHYRLSGHWYQHEASSAVLPGLFEEDRHKATLSSARACVLPG